MKYKLIFCFILVLSSLQISCKTEATQPKPKGYLVLEYVDPVYLDQSTENFSFDINAQQADFENLNRKGWSKIQYPSQKATLDLTYRKIQGNLRELLIEAEKMTFSHTIKADEISSQNYEDQSRKVYARIYQVGGNAASNLQFQVHDSISNFLTGSLYFKVKPNYDSIEPAIQYIRNDIIRLVESIQWTEGP